MPGHPRPSGTTKRYAVWLTPATRARVEAWAALQGCTFSAAAEALLRLGLEDAPPDGLAPVLELAVTGAVKEAMARVVAMQAAAALSGEAAYLAALALAKERFPAERYGLLKRAARYQALQTVRRRVARWGPEAAGLLASDPVTEPEDGPAPQTGGAGG
jgi:hypothetical protein